MATNKPAGDHHRNGSVKKRSQVHTSSNDKWTKRDRNSGEFVDQKSDAGKFKGVRRENAKK